MSSERKRIDQFQDWQLTREQLYHYKGKANAHFIVNGIVFHNSVSQQSSNLLRNFTTVEERPDLVDLSASTTNPIASFFKKFSSSIGNLFK